MIRAGGARDRPDRGAAAVEFALVVPLLLLLVFGIISYGFMLSFRQSLSQAATEGARAAAVTLDSTKRTVSAQDAVNDAMSAVGVTCTAGNLVKGGKTVGTCAVSAPAACAGSTGATCVTVNLTYLYGANPVGPTLPGVGLVIPTSLAYSATARVS